VLCNDADLQFDFVEQIPNAQFHDYYPPPPPKKKKVGEHIRHMSEHVLPVFMWW